MRTACFKLLSCLGLLQLAVALTTRRAYVQILNNTTQPIRAATVIHKYSDIYQHHGYWEVIQPGTRSGNMLRVEYHTGAFATGNDWWLVSWKNPEGTRYYYSNPGNGRIFFDTVEWIFAGRGGHRLESTTGFKQHTLMKTDANRVTQVVINTDNTIQFSSKSGYSSTTSSSTPIFRQYGNPQPFYAIAHRVLDKAGVEVALRHGANAVEIDANAWKLVHRGWWADHDGTLPSRGDRIRDVLIAAANARRAGKNLGFVWLDLKNPDRCGQLETGCNIEALRDMARQILAPVGVKILWGFTGSDINGRASGVVREDLTPSEAISIDGLSGTSARYAERIFNTSGPTNTAQRVWSKGLFQMALNFGSCEDKAMSASSGQICPEIRLGVMSGLFGKVFGWTITRNDGSEVNKLMHAGVDGLIYGHMSSFYEDTKEARDALQIINNWLKANSNHRYLANLDDNPW
ncbi:Sphingomyelinase D [Metarhizium brunneum]|uniref:Sphingomyelinase D n=1 Tax=Metarhizium brunneum TaxID=500148 RepID=A0A7D5UXT2_9HYPO|nr:Sphingomyelinase D [Metarhizium brunneum]